MYFTDLKIEKKIRKVIFFLLENDGNISGILVQHQSLLKYSETVLVDHGGLQASIKISQKSGFKRGFLLILLSPRPTENSVTKIY